ncbi:hypothetical protein PVK06_001799 [Gossypium arboreum]|uniref:Uncharacterized protein n=1 Tax=Gossypium arboreum TaxID=29729 RepID=A0ABR0R1X9_GOSAR|nr:hypothetical protein PVK06_001799 [Gossypium arboreum]
MHEPFLTPELLISPVYLDWSKHNSKSYQLSIAERSRQLHCRRRKQGSINLKLREHTVGRLTISPALHKDPIVVQPPEPRSSQPRRKKMNMEIIIEVHVKLKKKDN